MKAKIEDILARYGETIQYNTDISPEEAFTTTVDALMSLIHSSEK